jgi:hypothetical protein
MKANSVLFPTLLLRALAVVPQRRTREQQYTAEKCILYVHLCEKVLYLFLTARLREYLFHEVGYQRNCFLSRFYVSVLIITTSVETSTRVHTSAMYTTR